MSYLFVSTKRGSGAVQPIGSPLAEYGTTATFLGVTIPKFDRESALAAGTAWARSSDAALYRLANTWPASDRSFLDGLDGQGLFGTTATGATLDPTAIGGAGLALSSVTATPTSLSVIQSSLTDARFELSIGDAMARAGLTSIEVERIAEVNIRLGDGLIDGPDGRTLSIDAIDAVRRFVEVTNVEDAVIDARGAKTTAGVDVALSLYSDDANANHRVAVLGSAFDDAVRLTAGAEGADVEQGKGIAVVAHLGIGDDTFDSRGGGVLVTVDTVIGGQGSDVIYSGAGNDKLYGDYDATLATTDVGYEDMIDAVIGGKVFGEDASTVFVNVKAQLEFVGSESGYRNLVGYYYTDDDTRERVGGLVWDEDTANAEARENRRAVASVDVADLSVAEAATVGFFLLPNGAAINRIAGLTDTESAARTAQNGGRDGLINLWEAGNANVVVTVGSKGQGQVWLDVDKSGDLSNGDILLRGQTTNTLTVDTGITMGSVAVTYNGANPTAGATVFSGHFSNTTLNELGQDYVKTVGNVGDAFVDRSAGQGNPNVVDADTENGQVAFEETYGGVSGLAADRDYDDSVLQVRVTYEVGKNYGDDKLYGGSGDDEIYGDDNDDPCTSEHGGNDIIFGDDGLICVGADAVSVDDWVNGTGLTIYGRSGGTGPLWLVREGALADAPHFAITEAEIGLDPGTLPFSLGIDVDGTDTPRAGDGSDSHATGGNPEVNSQVEGSDYIGFRLPTAADVARITLSTFYARDGFSEGNIESVVVKLGNDLNSDGDLDDDGELIGTALILADGTVLEISPEFVAQGTRLSPAGFDFDNPGAFQICLQTALVNLGEGGAAAYSFTDIVLESGGIYLATEEGYVLASPEADPDVSDFGVVGLCYVPEQGNDTIYGGGGNDTIVGGGDRGFYTFTVKVTFAGSKAQGDSAFGYYFNDPEGPTTGTLIDARVQTDDPGDADDWGVQGDWTPSGPYNAGSAAPIASSGVKLIGGLSAAQVDSLGFFVIADGAQRGDDGSAASREGEVIEFQARIGGGFETSAFADGNLVSFTNSEFNPDGQVQASLTIGLNEFEVTDPTAIGSAQQMFGAPYVGFEDFITNDEAGQPGKDYNDVVVSLKLEISDETVGDWICGGLGEDTIIWNGASVTCVPQGGRADGFDVVSGFNVAEDTLRFDEWADGTARILDVSYQGGASTLIFDENYAAGTGVLLVGVTSSQLGSALVLF